MKDKIKEEIEGKITEFGEVLVDAGYLEKSASLYKGYVRRFYEFASEITSDNVKEYLSLLESREAFARRRVLYTFKRWLEDGIIPVKQKGMNRTEDYRPMCSRNCKHNVNCLCTYREGERLKERIIPFTCKHFSPYIPENLRRKERISENGCKIIFQDSHSIMYGYGDTYNDD